jgi:AAA domain
MTWADEARENARRAVELDPLSQPPASWYESAADLLSEDDPGPTPFLVEDLLVESAIAAIVGPPKKGKTWVLLDLAIAVAAGEPALGRFKVPKPGPVLLILEESGRAALHRRLDKLVRGRVIAPERLQMFYFAANRRVRLDDLEWQTRLFEAAEARPWRLIAFDPLARIKGAVDENVQREIGPVLDFMRDLRAVSSAAVAYVHHSPHEALRQRGSSDLESYWETKLTVAQQGEGRTLQAEHREAEGAGPFRLSFGFDPITSTLRLHVAGDEVEARVREYLDEHPTASANEVDDAVEGNRQRILEIVKNIREEGGSEVPEPPGTTPSADTGSGEWVSSPLKGAGTTPADPVRKPVPKSRNHPEEPDPATASLDELRAYYDEVTPTREEQP